MFELIFFRYKIWAKKSANRHNKKKDSRILKFSSISQKSWIFVALLRGELHTGQWANWPSRYLDTSWQILGASCLTFFCG